MPRSGQKGRFCLTESCNFPIVFSTIAGQTQDRNSMPDQGQPQLLHLVLGGELTDLEHVTFKDLDKVDIVGVFPNYASAHAAWRAKAQMTVDNAQMRYFIVHLHRLLDPSTDTKR
jgi:Domain of unknown function (DUF4170)